MDVKAPEGSTTLAARPIDPGGRGNPPDDPAPAAGSQARSGQQLPEVSSQEKLARNLSRMIEEAKRRTDRRVDISLDEETKEPVIRIFERESGKLVREIPPEVVRRVGDRLARIQGLLIDQDG